MPLLTATFLKGVQYSDMSWKTILTPAVDSGVVVSIGFGYAKMTPSGSVVWAKAVPTWRLDYIGTYPGGYFFTQDGSGFVLSLADGNGNIVRSFTYSSPTLCGTNVQDAVWDGDGFVFLLLSCFSDLSGYRPALVKVDTLGNVLWAKRYTSLGVKADALVKVGGRFFVAATDMSDTVIIFATDGGGNPLWAKKMGFTREMSYWGWRVMRLGRMGTDVLFYLRTGVEPLIRFDTLGNVVWDVRISYVGGYDLLTTGGSAYIAGVSKIAKVDGTGNLLWGKRYAPSTWSPTVYDLTFADGHIYAYADPYPAIDTAILIKVDTATGNAPCSEGASMSVYDTTFVLYSVALPAAENITLSTSSGETVSNTTVAVFNGCATTEVSEGEKPVPCGEMEIYDASGRRYERIPDRPGVYLVRTGGKVRKVIRRR